MTGVVQSLSQHKCQTSERKKDIFPLDASLLRRFLPFGHQGGQDFNLYPVAPLFLFLPYIPFSRLGSLSHRAANKAAGEVFLVLVAHFSKSIDRNTCASFKRPRITIDKEGHKEEAGRVVRKKRNQGEDRERRECACVSFLGDAPTRAGRYQAKDTDKNHTLSAVAKHLWILPLWPYKEAQWFFSEKCQSYECLLLNCIPAFTCLKLKKYFSVSKQQFSRLLYRWTKIEYGYNKLLRYAVLSKSQIILYATFREQCNRRSEDINDNNPRLSSRQSSHIIAIVVVGEAHSFITAVAGRII